MMKFTSFETIVEMIYKHAIPSPKQQCSKGLQLGTPPLAGGAPLATKVNSEHQKVPLSVLLKRELVNEKIIVSGQANQSLMTLMITLINLYSMATMGLQQLYTKENFLNNVLGAIPPDLNQDEWIAVLPRALVAGFVKTDKDFQEKGSSLKLSVELISLFYKRWRGWLAKYRRWHAVQIEQAGSTFKKKANKPVPSYQREREEKGERDREMTEISHRRSLRFLLLLSLISVQFLSGFSNDSKSKNETKTDAHSSSSMSGSTILILCIAVAAVVGLSFVLFRLWQKKKREEQYARLLKLFEEDDELELELGLRD
ncbi:hypothetical protein L6452_01551 [Arctium lappa]|uniref:Uncharacterized protein n=1 Tax=Arctium lappa TaxID=4217 RepID=A0ACB9FH26_ARCLA|nr:hypothetical protein L6452_01551 [Arctium lappa]